MAGLVIAISAVSGAAGSSTPQADAGSAAPLSPAASLAPDSGGAPKRAVAAAVHARGKCPAAFKAVEFYAGRIAYWTHQMARKVAPIRAHSACPKWQAHVLQRKAHALARAYARYLERRRAYFHRLYEKWRCIHEHEGAWNSNTGNGYWGGLQMDWGFMHTYGPEFIRRYGLAHRWPVWAQLVAAERAYWGFAGYAGRGYSPWGTRRMCGL